MGLGLYMGGCQSYDPFLGFPENLVPYYTRDPKMDHKFDKKMGAECFTFSSSSLIRAQVGRPKSARNLCTKPILGTYGPVKCRFWGSNISVRPGLPKVVSL